MRIFRVVQSTRRHLIPTNPAALYGSRGVYSQFGGQQFGRTGAYGSGYSGYRSYGGSNFGLGATGGLFSSPSKCIFYITMHLL